MHDLVKLAADLRRRKREWAQIARTAQISRPWIYRFCDGKIKNPGVHTLERVEAALRMPER